MKIIEITVSPKGETIVQTKGFAGSSCQEASKLIEQALGTKSSEQMTPEFYQQQTERNCAKYSRMMRPQRAIQMQSLTSPSIILTVFIPLLKRTRRGGCRVAGGGAGGVGGPGACPGDGFASSNLTLPLISSPELRFSHAGA